MLTFPRLLHFYLVRFVTRVAYTLEYRCFLSLRTNFLGDFNLMFPSLRNSLIFSSYVDDLTAISLVPGEDNYILEKFCLLLIDHKNTSEEYSSARFGICYPSCIVKRTRKSMAAKFPLLAQGSRLVFR